MPVPSLILFGVRIGFRVGIRVVDIMVSVSSIRIDIAGSLLLDIGILAKYDLVCPWPVLI